MLQHMQIMVLRVAPIDPGHPAINLFCIYIDARAFNTSDDPLVAVLHKWGHFHLLTETHIGHECELQTQVMQLRLLPSGTDAVALLKLRGEARSLAGFDTDNART